MIYANLFQPERAIGESSKQNMPSAKEQHKQNNQGEEQTAENLLARELHWPWKYWSMGML